MDTIASSFSFLKRSDFELIKFLLTVDSLNVATNVIEEPPISVRDISQLRLEINPTLNLHDSVLNLIRDGAGLIICMLHIIKNYESFGPLNAATFERVKGSQRKRLHSNFTMMVTPALDVRGWLLTDYMPDDIYQGIENQVLGYATSSCCLDTVSKDDVLETQIASLERVYCHPTYCNPVDINKYMRNLQTVLTDVTNQFELASDVNSSCIASTINDILFLCSLKNMLYRWRVLLQDLLAWTAYKADILLNDFMVLSLNIPTLLRYTCTLTEVASKIRGLNPFSAIYESQNEDPVDGDEPIKIQDLFYVYIRAYCKTVREIMDFSPDVHLDLEYMKYRMAIWKNRMTYSVLRHIPGEPDFSKTSAPSVNDPDMFPVGRTITLPRMVYPIYCTYTESVTDSNDTLNTSVVHSYAGNVLELLQDIYAQRPSGACQRPVSSISQCATTNQQQVACDVEMCTNDTPCQATGSSSSSMYMSTTRPCTSSSQFYQPPSRNTPGRTSGMTRQSGCQVPCDDVVMTETGTPTRTTTVSTTDSVFPRVRRISVGDSAYRVDEESVERVRRIMQKTILPKYLPKKHHR
ncbi:tegument protein UL35 [Proboscivirus elephantidbeta5]|uniref:Tegument protein UL35 n=1 Tax=Elephant endotheliotropic herpesvirus 5 TaxID=768738 RepID=A0A075CXR2_9BETA|nr:tegument protein UL35 [Elephant endotheliotropic herpesvirus 5]AHC02786.1 tegument protein UL35 [Elephant endotheliotropic herpesvirus 5]